jgi:hypothetical protein
MNQIAEGTNTVMRRFKVCLGVEVVFGVGLNAQNLAFILLCWCLNCLWLISRG